MKLNNIMGKKRYMCSGVLVTSLLLPLAAGAVSSSGTINIPFTITNPQQTCNLTFDNNATTMNYQLGAMNKGSRMEHRPFSVKVTCVGGTPKTAITARNTTGTRQSGDDSVIMRVNGQASSNGPLFWLENSGHKVKLTGSANDAFCSSADSPNNCQIRPVTDIPANSPVGNIDVTVVFDVTYPQ